MDSIELREGEDFIRLGQAMKKAGLVSSGVEAKVRIQDGEVLVNGEVDTERGKKLRAGDWFSFAGQKITVRPSS